MYQNTKCFNSLQRVQNIIISFFFLKYLFRNRFIGPVKVILNSGDSGTSVMEGQYLTRLNQEGRDTQRGFLLNPNTTTKRIISYSAGITLKHREKHDYKMFSNRHNRKKLLRPFIVMHWLLIIHWLTYRSQRSTSRWCRPIAQIRRRPKPQSHWHDIQ